ncbi:MAG: hypothetical protein AUI48_10205 [Chloroflexi bacterium 13_1_40CM_2_68_14]|nr:MAG: hypothetical protein AUI48_10205 [Chloroflexi bacterium 13_1_40CM_2_68_14]
MHAVATEHIDQQQDALELDRELVREPAAGRLRGDERRSHPEIDGPARPGAGRFDGDVVGAGRGRRQKRHDRQDCKHRLHVPDLPGRFQGRSLLTARCQEPRRRIRLRR